MDEGIGIGTGERGPATDYASGHRMTDFDSISRGLQEAIAMQADSHQLLTSDAISQRLSLQDWTRIRTFLSDLTDPEMYGFAVSEEVRRRALELQELFK